MTANHLRLAKSKVKLEALSKLWECANEELTPQESSNEFLLNKEDKERYAWHVAAKMGNVSILKKLWKWAKERQNAEELKQTFFFSKHLTLRLLMSYIYGGPSKARNANVLYIWT